MDKNFILFFVEVLQRIAFVILIYSFVSIVQLIYIYFFDYYNFETKNLFHFYGFIVSFCILQIVPAIKKSLENVQKH